MLRLVFGSEFFDEAKQEFVTVEDTVLEMEHSLVSLSKWESKWEVPFLGHDNKSEEQVLDYVKMMIVGPEPTPELFARITNDMITQVNTYINAKMSATWFNDKAKKGPGRIVTAEIIYYWMISLGIPFECQHWHLNRLLTLIKVCSAENAPKKKMSRAEAAAQQRTLNEQRLRQLNSTG